MRLRTSLPSPVPFLFLVGALAIGAASADAQVDPSWDHYRLYAASPLLIGPSVTVTDQFGTIHTSTALIFFLNPNEKTHDAVVYPINDPILHYTGWNLSAPLPVNRMVAIGNQFGSQQLNVQGDEQYLLNPALKNPAVGEQIPVANHYRCYNCSGPGLDILVHLRDQFGERDAIVRVPQYLCNPAEKTTSDGTTYPIVDPNQHYVCYQIDPVSLTNSAVVTDQFITDAQLSFSGDYSLCVPTEKFDPTPTAPGTWGRLKVIYR